MGMLAGVLIWAKLRLVTDIPRSAYADPREVDIQDPGLDRSEDDQSLLDESTSENADQTDANGITSQIIIQNQTHAP